MNRDEAQLILDASTLGDAGAVADEQLREARELMHRDVELEKWFIARHASDEQIAQAMAAVEVPAQLRDRLLGMNLAAAPPSNVVKFPGRRMLLLALAASVVIGLTAVLWRTPPGTPEMPRWESDSLAMVQGLDSGKQPLDHQTHDLNEIRGFLATAAAPTPEGLPRNLPTHPPVGCKTFLAAKIPASVVCFEIAPGVLAHLVTVKAGPEASGAQVGKPEFAANGAWHTAIWSDGKQTYIIGTRAEMGQLKHLFS